MSKLTAEALHGFTAAQVAEGVTDKSITKAVAVAFLTTRCTAAIDAGRIPKKPSVDLLNALGSPFEFTREDVRTRKQIKRGTPTLATRKSGAKPKARKGKAKAKSPAKSKTSIEAMLAALAKEHGVDSVATAFLKIAAKS